MSVSTLAVPRRVLLGALVVALVGAFYYIDAGRVWDDFLQLRVRGEAMTRERGNFELKREEIERRFKQGVAMLHMRQYDHAITAFHRVLELAPQMPEVHVNMGYALLGQRDYQAAVDFFRSALAIKADQANAYYGLGLALEGLGDFDGALGALRTYAHLVGPDDPYRQKAAELMRELEEAVARRREPGQAALGAGR